MGVTKWEGVVVGYPAASVGYQVWDPVREKVFNVGVPFVDEDVKPGWWREPADGGVADDYKVEAHKCGLGTLARGTLVTIESGLNTKGYNSAEIGFGAIISFGVFQILFYKYCTCLTFSLLYRFSRSTFSISLKC